jgi:hypothetical protein
MSKEFFMAAHDELIEEYLEAHPNANWSQAYDATADAAYGRMQDRMADWSDAIRQQRKEGLA